MGSDGRFKKGEVHNPRGRKKGSKNIRTREREDLVRGLLDAIDARNKKLDGNWFETLSDSDLIGLCKIAMPKEAKIDISAGKEILYAILNKIKKSPGDMVEE